jgi:hypothetical protein
VAEVLLMNLLLLGFLAVEPPALEADLPQGKRLVVHLDGAWTPDAFASAWGTGESAGPPATVLLQKEDGAVLARRVLDAPLARLALPPLRTPAGPVILVESDLTARMGTFDGPVAIGMRVTDHGLAPVEQVDASGQRSPLRVSSTARSAWRRVDNGGVDDLLQVSCERTEVGNQLATHLRRLHPTVSGWVVTERVEPGCWEAEAAFPPVSAFPPAG